MNSRDLYSKSIPTKDLTICILNITPKLDDECDKSHYLLGSSGNLVASFRHQIELSAVEQNSQAVVLEISKSPGGGLDGLDPAVESAHIAFCLLYTSPSPRD